MAEFKFIQYTILASYETDMHGIISLKALKNKRDDNAKNWIVLMPTSLGIAIIMDGGLIININPLSPHTSISVAGSTILSLTKENIAKIHTYVRIAMKNTLHKHAMLLQLV